MKRAFQIILAAALCAALLAGLISTAGAAPANVYQMAVNDTPVEMTAGNMPMMVGGVLYVPYTMLSSRTTGINLGVTAQYNSPRWTLTVSDGQRTVTFDLQNNTSYDTFDTPLSIRAVARNAMVFLPIMWLCDYFGSIRCSLTYTRYGTLVRVTNSAVILSDAEYVDAAASLMANNYDRYLESIQPPPTPVSTPRPSAAPSPTVTPRPSELPGQGAEVVLAYRWGDQAEEAARLLENANQRALFLFAPEELAAQDGLVRRLAARGHTIGLFLAGESGEECLAQAEEGSALLAAIARCPVFLVEAPALSGDGRAALEEAGYVLWEPDLRGEDYSSASAVMRALSAWGLNRVELTCDEPGLALSRNLWSAMTSASCRVRQATAPLLAPAN